MQVNMEDKSLGQILLEQTPLTPQQLEEALVIHREKGTLLGEALIQLRFLRNEDILKALAIQAGLPYINELDPEQIPNDLISLVPINFAKKNEILPLKREDGVVYVVMADPFNHAAVDDLRLIFDHPVRPVVANSQQILDDINSCYNRKDGSNRAVMSDYENDEENLDLEEREEELEGDDEEELDEHEEELETEEEHQLLAKLKAKRMEIAMSQNVPPYVVFHDKTLFEMIKLRPKNVEALAGITGVGEAKIKKYGKVFLGVLG